MYVYPCKWEDISLKSDVTQQWKINGERSESGSVLNLCKCLYYLIPLLFLMKVGLRYNDKTDKSQAFYIIFSVLYDIFYLTLCPNFPVCFLTFIYLWQSLVQQIQHFFHRRETRTVCCFLFPNLPTFSLLPLLFVLPSCLPAFLPSSFSFFALEKGTNEL